MIGVGNGGTKTMSRDSEHKIAKARVGMMFDTPFFGHLALNFELVENNQMKMPTMATDGRRLFYDENFVKQTSLEHLKFIIAHEVMHIVLWHIPRRIGREPDLWNQASDFVDNEMVKKDFPDTPPGILLNSEFDGKTADWVYTQLPNDGKSKGGKTLDDHDPWGMWGKDDPNGKDGEGKDGQNQNGPAVGGQSGIEQEWREKIASAAMVARQRGKLPGSLEELVGEVLQPKLSWKAILRDTVTSVAKNDFKWIPCNKKHIHRGFYLPGISGEEIKVAVAIDTSGSIGSEQLSQFLGEIEGICHAYETYTLHLYACDAQIHKYWELHEMDPIPRNMPGRGGTSFKPVLDDLADGKKEFSVLIYLTDLYGDQMQLKDPGYPVIWVSTTPNQKAPFGKIIELDIEQK
jgi:predicted metal-dependent peptidase